MSGVTVIHGRPERVRGPRLRGDLLVAGAMLGAYVVLTRPAEAAAWAEPVVRLSPESVLAWSMVIALILTTVLLCRLVLRLVRRAGRLRPSPGWGGWGESGTVAVEFIFVLPVVLYLVSSIVQTALLGQAAVLTRYAAFCAARAAIVNTYRTPGSAYNIEEITDLGEQRGKQAASLVLATISPDSPNSGAALGNPIRKIRNREPAPWRDNRYQNRVTFALAATSVEFNLSYPPILTAPNFMTIPGGQGGFFGPITDILGPIIGNLVGGLSNLTINPQSIGMPNYLAPRTIEAEVTYQYMLIGPGVAKLLTPNRTTIAGVDGRFFPITSKVTLQSTGSRQQSLITIFFAGSPL